MSSAKSRLFGNFGGEHVFSTELSAMRDADIANWDLFTLDHNPYHRNP